MSTNYIDQITDTAGTTHDISEGDSTRIFRATCTTAAATAAKAATLQTSDRNFSLATGVRVAVTFTYGNSAATPTLNVNSTGAKTIAVATSATAKTTGNGTTYNTWGPYETVLFTYDGTYWINGGSSRSIYNAYALAGTDEKLTVENISNNTNYSLLLMPSSGTIPRTATGNINAYEFAVLTDGSSYSQLNIGGENFRGQIGLGYKDGNVTSYTYLKSTHTSTGRTISFPDKTGTVALTTDIPTKTSELTNDSGFVTSSGVTSIATTSPISGGTITGTGTISHATSGVGTATTTAGFYKFKYDTYGHVTGVSSVTTSDITSLVTIPTNTDENVKSTAVTAATTNYITGSTTATTTTGGLSKHASAVLYTTADSSTSGYTQLRLGNTTATSSAGGKEGQIRLYGTNATYYLDLKPGAIASSNKTITFPNKTGTVALTDDIPDVSGKIDTAGTGLSKSGTTLNHSNSVTAQTTQAVYPITFDAQGHITGSGSAVTIPSAYTLPVATYNTLGGVKPWKSYTASSTGPTAATASTAVSVNAITDTASRYYAIEMDKDGRMFVNVPWTNVNSDYITSDSDYRVQSIPLTTATTYYLLGSGSSSDVTSSVNKHASISAYVTADSSTSGSASIIIGNSTPSGTAGAKDGYLRLYGSTAYRHDIRAYGGYPAANRTVYLPRYTSTMYLTCVSTTSAVGGATTAPVYVDNTGTIKSVTSIPYTLLSGAPTVSEVEIVRW